MNFSPARMPLAVLLPLASSYVPTQLSPTVSTVSKYGGRKDLDIMPRSQFGGVSSAQSLRVRGAMNGRHLVNLKGLFDDDSSYQAEINGLTPEAIEGLLDASGSLYTVDALEKAGKTLVVLGESHVKPPIAARAGERVLEHFPVRILEGATLPGEQESDTTDASVDGGKKDQALVNKKSSAEVYGVRTFIFSIM